MPHYLIRTGEQFRDTDGSIKAGGQTIELDAEMAALHAAKVHPEPVGTANPVTLQAAPTPPAAE